MTAAPIAHPQILLLFDVSSELMIFISPSGYCYLVILQYSARFENSV